MMRSSFISHGSGLSVTILLEGWWCGGGREGKQKKRLGAVCGNRLRSEGWKVCECGVFTRVGVLNWCGGGGWLKLNGHDPKDARPRQAVCGRGHSG